MKARFLFAILAAAGAASMTRSQVLDFPVTVPLGVTAGFESGGGDNTYFYGTFGAGVSGYVYQWLEWSPGWYETGKEYFQVRPGKDYYFSVESNDVGGFLLRFDPPVGHRVFVEDVNRQMHEGNGGFGYYYTAQYKVRLEAIGSESAGLIGAAGSLRPQRVLWDASMGYLRNGRGAGAIELREATVSAAVNSGKLYYDSVSSEVHVVYGTGGTLRQVKVPDGLADIVTLGGTSYEVRFYRISQMGTFNGSVYPLTGNAFLTYKVEQVATDWMKITMTRGARVEITEMKKTTSTSWEVSDWTKSGETCERTLLYDFPSGSTIEDLTVKNGSTVASRVRKTYTSVGGSMELETETAGYGTANLVTTYAYHTNAGYPGSYRKILSVTRPDGGWVKFDYNNSWLEAQGMLWRKYEPYMDAPTTAAGATTTNCKLTEYTYEADWTLAERRPAVITSKVNGVKTGHVDIDYSDITVDGKPVVVETRTEYSESGLNGSHARTTVVKYFREDAPADTVQFWPGVPYSVTLPDGTKKAYSYAEGVFLPTQRAFSPLAGGEYISELVVTGSSNSSHGSAWTGGSFPVDTVYVVSNQSTMHQTIRSRSGVVVYESTSVHNGSSWVRPDGILTGSSEDRQPLYHFHDNGNYSAEWNYVDGRTNWFKDADGVQTSYTYDRHGRLESTKKTGVTGTSPFPSPVDVTTTYGYDASNRVVSTSTSAVGTGETLVASRTFDQAGRPTASTHHDSGTIGFSYPSAREVTMTLPGPVAGGGTRTVTTETYIDGRFKRRTGNADVPAFHQFAVDSGNGRELIHQKPTEAGTDRWHNTWFDWLGRPAQTFFPTFDEPGNQNAINVTDYIRSGPDRVVQTRNWSVANGWNSPLTPDILYAYGKMGELVTATADINQNGTSDAGDKDRIVKSEARFEIHNGDTWQVSRAKALPTAGESTERTTGEVRVRLTNNPYGQFSQVERYDSAGRKSTETVTINRATRVRTSTVTTDGVTNAGTTQWHNGLLFRTISPASVATTMSYDNLGRLSNVAGRSSVEEKYTYVTGKTLVYEKSSKYGTGLYLTTDRFTYDNAGRVTLHESFNYKVGLGTRTGTKRFEYDALGQVVRQWGNAVQPVQYEFNTFGQMTKMWTFDTGDAFATQSNWPGGTGRLTQWAYQYKTGLPQTRTDAAGRTISYEYNLRGQPRKKTVQRGSGADVVTNYIYYDGGDEGSTHLSYRTGELKKVDYPDTGLGATPDVFYEYDRLGRIKKVTDGSGDPSGTREFFYRDGTDLQLDYELLPSFFGSRKVVRTYETGGAAGRYSGFAFKESNDSATWQNASYT